MAAFREQGTYLKSAERSAEGQSPFSPLLGNSGSLPGRISGYPV